MTSPFQRYLGLLGLDRSLSGLDGLRTLVARHLERVPFENISKLLLYDREHAGRALTLEEFLDGVEYQDLGGTCHATNPFFAALLRELGYDADLLGADMGPPNVHMAIRVRLDSFAYHVDVGFAAPFREPIRLDSIPTKIAEGGNRYVFDRDPGGAGFRMSMFTGAGSRLDYVAHDPPRAPEFFRQIVTDSYAPVSWFMQRLRISRIFAGYSVDLIDKTLHRHEAGKTVVTELRNMPELRAAVRDELEMPRCPVEAAVKILERLTGKPVF